MRNNSRPPIRLICMKNFQFILLIPIALSAAAPNLAGLPASKPEPDWNPRPDFLAAETPWQMTAQVGTSVVTALLGGAVLGTIMSNQAVAKCRETIEPDFSDECGWSGLGGLIAGLIIGVPVGHSLGTLTVGSIQGKKGAPLAALAALAGDAAVFFLALGIHERFDGKLLPNGQIDKLLIPLSVCSMLAIPVVTQSLYDYHVRFPLQPRVSFGATPDKNRYAVDLLQVSF